MEFSIDWVNWYLLKYFYLYLIVLVLAALEVQIEGKHAWSAKLPTWRIKSKVFGFFMGGKELTGYLAYLLILILLLFHLPFLGGVPWTPAAEIEVIMLFFLFSVYWDFMWFVLNPYFGIKKMKKKYVHWHRDWIAGVPADYPRGILVALIISCFDYPWGVIKWGIALGVFTVLSLVIIALTSLKRRT